MTLQEYINSFPKDERRKAKLQIAKAATVREASVTHWCNGTRKIKPANALLIEEFTEGLVGRLDLRPDIYRV